MKEKCLRVEGDVDWDFKRAAGGIFIVVHPPDLGAVFPGLSWEPAQPAEPLVLYQRDVLQHGRIQRVPLFYAVPSGHEMCIRDRVYARDHKSE